MIELNFLFSVWDDTEPECCLAHILSVNMLNSEYIIILLGLISGRFRQILESGLASHSIKLKPVAKYL